MLADGAPPAVFTLVFAPVVDTYCAATAVFALGLDSSVAAHPSAPTLLAQRFLATVLAQTAACAVAARRAVFPVPADPASAAELAIIQPPPMTAHLPDFVTNGQRLEVRTCGVGNVSRNGENGSETNLRLMLRVVGAVPALAALAVMASRETRAVQLETSRFLTLANPPPLRARAVARVAHDAGGSGFWPYMLTREGRLLQEFGWMRGYGRVHVM